MKLILTILILLSFTVTNVSAQNDSSAYEAQRKKINQLLEERSGRFGQYESSLDKRSGIFGLKTKKDMQFSNDILRQIVLTDNAVFSELKILLDYKSLEKQQVEEKAETIEARIERYKTSITKLQQENEKLRIQAEKNIAESDKQTAGLFILIITLIVSIWYIFKLKKLLKSDKSGIKNA